MRPFGDNNLPRPPGQILAGGVTKIVDSGPAGPGAAALSAPLQVSPVLDVAFLIPAIITGGNAFVAGYARAA